MAEMDHAGDPMMSSQRGAGEELLQPWTMAGEHGADGGIQRSANPWEGENEVVWFVCLRTAMARSGKAWQARLEREKTINHGCPNSATLSPVSLKEPFYAVQQLDDQPALCQPGKCNSSRAHFLHEVTSHTTLNEARWSAGARAKVVSDSTRSKVCELCN